MKKITYLIGALFIGMMSVNQAKAQQAFQEGDNFITAGYGVGNFTLNLLNLADGVDMESKAFGPFYLKYENALGDKFGFGVNLAYVGADITTIDRSQQTSEGKDLIQKVSWDSYSVLARMNWHWGMEEKIDPYIGVGFGYRDGFWKATDNDPNQDFDPGFKSVFNFGFESTIGLRVLPHPNIGFYAEVGLAKSWLQFGLTSRF